MILILKTEDEEIIFYCHNLSLSTESLLRKSPVLTGHQTCSGITFCCVQSILKVKDEILAITVQIFNRIRSLLGLGFYPNAITKMRL